MLNLAEYNFALKTIASNEGTAKKTVDGDDRTNQYLGQSDMWQTELRKDIYITSIHVLESGEQKLDGFFIVDWLLQLDNMIFIWLDQWSP